VKRALSEVDTAEAVARYKMGSSLLSISRTLDTHVSSVRRALVREGVELRVKGWRHTHPEHLTKSIVAMRAHGYSWADVSAALEIPIGTARKRFDTASRRAARDHQA
jgi:hypothetical protein